MILPKGFSRPELPLEPERLEPPVVPPLDAPRLALSLLLKLVAAVKEMTWENRNGSAAVVVATAWDSPSVLAAAVAGKAGSRLNLN